MIRAISSASFKRRLHEPFDSSPEASSRRNQYNVSRASLSAMLYLLIKSARLCPACASSTFAPTEVPDRNNCCAKVRNDPALESRLRHKRTTSSAKLKVLSFMSRGRPASFTFAFLLLPSKRRGACGRSAMMRRLFVGVGELDQITIVVGSSNKANARWEVVARESRGDDDGRNVD
jgi:hypothetical protein